MKRLIELQRRLATEQDHRWAAADLNRLTLTREGDLLHVHYYGTNWEEPFSELADALIEPDVAGTLASIDLSGPDEGANGTNAWDLRFLAECNVEFPVLREFTVERSKPEDHNQSVVEGATYEEAGVLAKILAKAPNLARLEVPSAPNSEFFQVGIRPIEMLSVDAGYDHQSFIRNLAQSDCFPALETLKFGEFSQTYMNDYRERVTPLDDYRALVSSPAFSKVNYFVWRNPACSPDELVELASLIPHCQFQVVRTSATYIRLDRN